MIEKSSVKFYVFLKAIFQERNVSFPGSWETGTGFSQPRVHTVMVGRVPAVYEFLPITVGTRGWENQFLFPNFLEEAFSDITVINHV